MDFGEIKKFFEKINQTINYDKIYEGINSVEVSLYHSILSSLINKFFPEVIIFIIKKITANFKNF